MSVLLKKPLFEGVSQKELVEQLEAKKKCKDKLPTWFNTPNIYYPNKLNIEQTSSEETARYKADLVDGKTLLDLTGGLGVDSYFFSKKIDTVFHCEINEELSEIAQYNFEVLDQKNIVCIPEEGIGFLQKTDEKLDWIFVDPSRRNNKIGKVFLFKDCLPDLPEHLPLLFKKAKNILVKASPLLDIKQGIEELNFVKEIHVVAINNEVKEVLFVLEKDYQNSVVIKTINKTQNQEMVFSFNLEDEKDVAIEFDEPKTYLYEPNAAILKSGGFKSVAALYGLKKLHQHSHLYTSDRDLDFPGRRFSILKALTYSKSTLKQFAHKKANITTRNFPMPVSELRKKHNIKDGGDTYLFFTKTAKEALMVLECKKME
ncbi:THUMP-like domain-containing protein [Allomuricauda sp. CAU 1633]|uniref:THUMP-like domain-containing protein n=1 Tax=Allomuricauda sp. CAU 1633 TaxID=2816036 RepID=UPI00293D3395|nr:class I SAM-dependent methyltransferase [Muricauda sp. CAU 1633]